MAFIENVRPELKKRFLGYIEPFVFGKMIYDEFRKWWIRSEGRRFLELVFPELELDQRNKSSAFYISNSSAFCTRLTMGTTHSCLSHFDFKYELHLLIARRSSSSSSDFGTEKHFRSFKNCSCRGSSFPGWKPRSLGSLFAWVFRWRFRLARPW